LSADREHHAGMALTKALDHQPSTYKDDGNQDAGTASAMLSAMALISKQP